MLGAGIMGMSAFTASASTRNDVALRFDPTKGVKQTLTLPDGKTVNYLAYEHIYYVTNVEDSTYQFLNIYVPENIHPADHRTPIFLRTYVGGYMAASAMSPSETDATGRALSEGYVVCIPGSRGWNSIITNSKGETIFTGRAPAGLIDLKAAIRYLRFNDDLIPGNSEKIITDGTSAGGAMSALLGSTGNHPDYEPYLREAGAAEARDDVFAAICYCPIIDLDHADMAYEWLYNCTNRENRALSEEQIQVSDELADAYSSYLNSLNLKMEDGTPLTDKNYLEYVKTFLIQSAQKARNEGYDMPDNAGIVLNQRQMPGHNRPNNQDGNNRQAPSFGPQGNVQFETGGEFVVDIKMDQYLNYVVSKQPLKTPPAFDQQGVLTKQPTPENSVFGDANGSSVNFTDYSLRKATGNPQATIDEQIQKRVRIMNPMNYVADPQSVKASYWYIRHGACDRDTAFPVPINFATLLKNKGYQVNFALPWNRPHTGDYNLDDLFSWIHSITQ